MRPRVANRSSSQAPAAAFCAIFWASHVCGRWRRLKRMHSRQRNERRSRPTGRLIDSHLATFVVCTECGSGKSIRGPGGTAQAYALWTSEGCVSRAITRASACRAHTHPSLSRRKWKTGAPVGSTDGAAGGDQPAQVERFGGYGKTNVRAGYPRRDEPRLRAARVAFFFRDRRSLATRLFQYLTKSSMVFGQYIRFPLANGW